MVSIQNDEGTEVHHSSKIITTVKDCYKNLYKLTVTDEEEPTVRPPQMESYTSPILISEITSILHNLNPNKCPGPDQIKNEWLKSYVDSKLFYWNVLCLSLIHI